MSNGITRIFILGAIVLAVGLAIIFPTFVSYAIWKRANDSIKLQIEEYDKNPRSCGSESCEPPHPQAYDNALTWRIMIGSVIAPGGTAGIIHGVRHDDKL